MDRETVLALYGSGVDAVVGAVDGWTDADWALPACGVWTGTDLAGHLVSVIGWYHDWLDRAVAGDAAPAFPIAELDTQTAASLAALPTGTGPDRIDAFRTAAQRYAARLVDRWDLPYGYPRGTVTAGLHAGVAAVEWHIHAWDLVRSAGGTYAPAEASNLFLAAAECQLAILGGLREQLGLRAARVASKRRPWAELLRRMGRS